jgi:hypothetical protein
MVSDGEYQGYEWTNNNSQISSSYIYTTEGTVISRLYVAMSVGTRQVVDLYVAALPAQPTSVKDSGFWFDRHHLI